MTLKYSAENPCLSNVILDLIAVLQSLAIHQLQKLLSSDFELIIVIHQVAYPTTIEEILCREELQLFNKI